MRHHYVPQFWIRRFSDGANNLHCRQGAGVRIVSSRDVMQMDGLYAIFDSKWRPSERLESVLGRMEGAASRLFDVLDDPAIVLTDIHAGQLTEFLALQACRHPDVMSRGHRRARELAEFLASVHDHSKSEFVTNAAKFGIPPAEAEAIYRILLARSPESLFDQLDDVLSLSPQDPNLPSTDALRALPVMTALFARLQWTVLKAPSGSSFVLGDTPLPQSDLAGGFRVPLSASTAVTSTVHVAGPWISRLSALPTDVEDINREQWANAAAIAVGPDVTVLRSL
jgi:hypothetical protein